MHAEWWSLAPADFEACADLAEKAPTKEEKKAALTRCNAKFAGRRKPGGGYTYYDFMQNRSFDIAGPNPTPAEQKYIDEQYTLFLDRERRNAIVQELAAKQQQMESQHQQRETAAAGCLQERDRKGAAAVGVAEPASGRGGRAEGARQGPCLRRQGRHFPANGLGSPKGSTI